MREITIGVLSLFIVVFGVSLISNAVAQSSAIEDQAIEEQVVTPLPEPVIDIGSVGAIKVQPVVTRQMCTRNGCTTVVVEQKRPFEVKTVQQQEVTRRTPVRKILRFGLLRRCR